MHVTSKQFSRLTRGRRPWYLSTETAEALLFGAVQSLMVLCVVLVGAELVAAF